MANYAKVSEVSVGTPATYSIGSDRYATEIVKVTYYKTGKLAGFVKTVEVKSGSVFRPYQLSDRISWRKAPEQWWGTLFVGFAEDYRDPSF